MKRLSFLFLMLIMCATAFGQTKIVSAADSQSSESVEFFKGELNDDLSTEYLAELLRDKKLVSAMGGLHEAFRENPATLANALVEKPEVRALFINYLEATDQVTRKTYEDQLLLFY